MTKTVYVETSIPSFYHEVRTEPEMVVRREWTRQWWNLARERYELVTSPAVVDELERGDYPSRKKCLELNCFRRKTMKPDPGLQATRDIRHTISRELGNDPRRLVEYYMDYQRRFAGRLRAAPGTDQVLDSTAEQADATDRPSAGR